MTVVQQQPVRQLSANQRCELALAVNALASRQKPADCWYRCGVLDGEERSHQLQTPAQAAATAPGAAASPAAAPAFNSDIVAVATTAVGNDASGRGSALTAAAAGGAPAACAVVLSDVVANRSQRRQQFRQGLPPSLTDPSAAVCTAAVADAAGPGTAGQASIAPTAQQGAEQLQLDELQEQGPAADVQQTSTSDMSLSADV